MIVGQNSFAVAVVMQMRIYFTEIFANRTKLAVKFRKNVSNVLFMCRRNLLRRNDDVQRFLAKTH